MMEIDKPPRRDLEWREQLRRFRDAGPVRPAHHLANQDVGGDGEEAALARRNDVERLPRGIAGDRGDE
jgi:hypothetical protein